MLQVPVKCHSKVVIFPLCGSSLAPAPVILINTQIKEGSTPPPTRHPTQGDIRPTSANIKASQQNLNIKRIFSDLIVTWNKLSNNSDNIDSSTYNSECFDFSCRKDGQKVKPEVNTGQKEERNSSWQGERNGEVTRFSLTFWTRPDRSGAVRQWEVSQGEKYVCADGRPERSTAFQHVLLSLSTCKQEWGSTRVGALLLFNRAGCGPLDVTEG